MLSVTAKQSANRKVKVSGKSKTLAGLCMLLTLLNQPSGVAFAQAPSTPPPVPSSSASIPASSSSSPLSFRAWKQREIAEARGQVLKLAATASALRNGKTSATGKGKKIKKVQDGNPPTLAAAEQDLKRARESLENARKLRFADYVEIYVPTLKDQPEAQDKLAQKLSKEELEELAKTLMHKSAEASTAPPVSANALPTIPHSNDATHVEGDGGDGLPLTAHSKSQQ